MDNADRTAVIFDVDGPLLDLTAEEEDAFFVPFDEYPNSKPLSRDWDTYRVRNDLEIYRDILTGLLGRNASEGELDDHSGRYVAALEQAYETGAARAEAIPGALQLLEELNTAWEITLGMSTANFRDVARIRLQQTGMWRYVREHPGSAEYGGHKRNILARVVSDVGLSGDRIVYLGDNLNDLDAAQSCGVHFIGFCLDASRRQRLTDAGAVHVTGLHTDSLVLIKEFLDLS